MLSAASIDYQIVGRERRERVSHLDLSGDAGMKSRRRVNSTVRRCLCIGHMQKTKSIFLSILLVAALSASVQTADLHRYSSSPDDVAWTKFDEYSNISFEKEKARLNEFISVLRSEPTQIAYIVAYAGRQACVSEAQERAKRVKRYLQRAGIRSARLKTVDAGYQKEWQIDLYVAPPIPLPHMNAVIASTDGHLPRADVKVLNCKATIHSAR